MIRRIQESDNPKLAKLIRGIFDEYDAPKTGTVYSDPTTDKLYQLFQTIGSSCFVYTKNEIPMGCCGIFPTKGLPHGHVELVKFYLHHSVRGEGWGRSLFEKCLEAAKEMAYHAVYIESQDSFVEAVQLYKKYGFKHLNEPLGDSGHHNCKIWMVKRL